VRAKLNFISLSAHKIMSAFGCCARFGAEKKAPPPPAKRVNEIRPPPFGSSEICPDNRHLHSGHRGSECIWAGPDFLRRVSSWRGAPKLKPWSDTAQTQNRFFRRKFRCQLAQILHNLASCVRYYLVKEKQSFTRNSARSKNGVIA